MAERREENIMEKNAPLLEMRHISKSFSGVYANQDVSMVVEKGEIHALLGENGAGKTTLMNILYGLYQADAGEILWKGKPVHFSSPEDAIRTGIGMVQQHFSLVRAMSVLDNVILGLGSNHFFLDREKAAADIESIAERYGLPVDVNRKVSDMSVGEMQRTEILKALYRHAELLILDEPTGVLTPQETDRFFEVLHELKEQGFSVIVITHRMSEIMRISDRVTILRDGVRTADLVTKDTNPEELSFYMIGRHLNPEPMVSKAPGEEKMLTVEHLEREPESRRRPLKNISFSLRKGEILGLAGVEGNGQKELAEVISGIIKPSGGTVKLEGQDITRTGIRERYERGLAYISDDRQNDSLILHMNIMENLLLRDYYRKPYSVHGVIHPDAWKENGKKKMSTYQIKASGHSDVETKVSLMSGGNQQKLIIARELTGNAKVIIASQPTRGLDIGATYFVHENLRKAAESGKGVLLISADLEELFSLCDRIAVLYSGQIAGILDRESFDEQKIGLLMGGIREEEAGR